MNLSVARIFGDSRSVKHILDERMHMLLPGYARYKSDIVRPKAFVRKTKKTRQYEDTIGMFGYCLLTIPIATFALGTWQIKRWRWKLNLIENIKQNSSLEPIDLPFNLDDLKDQEYRRVKMKGKFLYEKEFLMGPRSLIVEGQQVIMKQVLFDAKMNGYYVITPFKLEDRDLSIMVNRGWIPKSERTVFKQKNKITDPIEIVGVVRASEKRPQFVAANNPTKGVWHYRNLEEMAKIAETEPVYVELSVGYAAPDGPVAGQTRVTLKNDHLSYIITWYGLSASTGYLWFRQFVQKLPL